MSATIKTDEELWSIAAESGFEVVLHSLRRLGRPDENEKIDPNKTLIESRAATCALQELANRAGGEKPKPITP